VNFSDTILLRFADDGLRPALLDELALEQLARACYDLDALAATGPFGAEYDEVRLGVPLPGAGGRLDAVWRGAITAHGVESADVITRVDGGWQDREGDLYRSRLNVAFAPAPSTAVPLRLPVVVGLKFRDKTFSVGDLLAESRTDRDRLESLGLADPESSTAGRRRGAAIAWIVPSAVFDDPGWPGGAGPSPAELRASRRARAATWLPGAGVAIAVVETQ
jgi:hypothetical protein